MPAHRFYSEFPLQLGLNTLDDQFILQHIKVLRLKINDTICLFNKNQTEYNCNIHQINKKNIVIDCLDEKIVSRELPKKIHLMQSIINANKLELIVEKANELGASSINLIPCQYSNYSLGENKQKRIQRLQSIAISSSEQCRRNSLIDINTFSTWNEFIEYLQNIPKNCLKIIFLPHTETLFKSINFADYSEFYCIIGAEGGFSVREEQELLKCGCISLNLGNRILRAETAAISAVSFIALNLY